MAEGRLRASHPESGAAVADEVDLPPPEAEDAVAPTGSVGRGRLAPDHLRRHYGRDPGRRQQP